MTSSILRLFVLAVLSLTAVAAPSSSNPGDRCCYLLELSYPHDTSSKTYNTTAYDSSLKSYWSLQARTKPSCIVAPSSAVEISHITKTLVSNSCQFAIRSGGHNPFPDNNIGPGGVTLDLSRLSAVTFNEKTDGDSTASIGPGARWGDVYTYLGKKNVTVGGGRAADVGVGGLTLGGGNSFFAARFGFVCDNVVNFEVVLASGEIINANKSSNADLWQVLKGGSNNFGIVTRIDLTIIEEVDIWGGVVLYPSSTIPSQIDAFVKFTDGVNNDPYASLITFWAYTSASNTTVVENCYEYTKNSAPPPNSIFKDLLAISPEIPGTNTLAIRNLTSLTLELEAKSGLRDLFATYTFDNDAELIKKIYAYSQLLLEPVKTAKGLNWIVMFQPIPTSISKQSVKRGGNIMGLDRNKSNQVLFLFFVQWDDTADDKALNKAATELIHYVQNLTNPKKDGNHWIYLNYALANQDALGSYGKANLHKIKQASKKYDPNGVFQKLVPGGFKIANAEPSSP